MKEQKELFEQAYKENADALFRYSFFRTGDRETAKDLLQETLVKSWKYIVDGHRVENLKPFFYKVMHNLIIDSYRNNKKKTSSLEAMQEDDGFDPPVDDGDQMRNQIDGEKAIKMIDKIPEPYRETVLMRYVQGLEISEIAEIFGQSENTVNVRIHRGIDKLKKLYFHE